MLGNCQLLSESIGESHWEKERERIHEKEEEELIQKKSTSDRLKGGKTITT